MYATNRLLGFESYSKSSFGAQTAQVSVKPTPEVQKLLDAASKLPIPEQKAALEKALDAAIAAKDNVGASVALDEIEIWFNFSKVSRQDERLYLEILLKRFKDAGFEMLVAKIYIRLSFYENFDRNLAFLRIAADIYAKNGSKAGTANVLRKEGELFLFNGDKGRGRARLNDALTLARQIRDLKLFSEAALRIFIEDEAEYYAGRNFTKFQLAFSKILGLCHEVGAKGLIVYVLGQISEIHRERGELAKAIELHQDRISVARSLDDSTLSSCLKDFGDLDRMVGNVMRAEKSLLEALAIARKSRDGIQVMFSLISLSDHHFDTGYLDKSQAEIGELSEVSRLDGDEFFTMSADLGQARILLARGNPDGALALFVPVSEKGIGWQKQVAALGLARIYAMRGDMAHSNSIYEEWLRKLRSDNSKLGLVKALIEYSQVMLACDSYSVVMSALLESEKLSRAAKFIACLATNRLTFACLLDTLGRPEAAAASRAEAGKLFAELFNPNGQAYVLVGEGDARLAAGDPSTALSLYTRALDLRTQATLAEGAVGGRIGEALLALGRLSEAIVSLEGFIERNRAKGIVADLPRALCTLGRAQLRQNRQDNAKASFLGALSIAEQTGDANEAANAFRELSEIALRQGNVAGAILLGKRGIDARQSQRAGASGLDDGLRTSLSSRLAPDYRRLADLLVVEGRVSEAEQVLALLKESELRAAGAATERRDTVLPRSGAESDGEKAYQLASAETVALGARLRVLELAKQPSKEVLAERADLLKRLETAEKSFAKEMERIVAEARSVGSGSRAEALQGAGDGISKALLDLPEGTAALSMLWLEDRVRLILTTPSVRVIRTSMVDARTLGKRILAFREVLTDPSKDPVPAARSLYDILWKPVAQDIAKLKIRDVLLSLDGPVRYIPLGALHDGSAYLAERLCLSLFSPTERDRITQRPSNRWDVLFAGMSTSRTVDDGLGSTVTFSNLPAVRDEARRVRSVLSGGPPPVLDAGFDLQSLRTGLLARPKVVHLASHFLLRSGSESESFLLTGKGDVLRISDSQTLSPSLFRSVELLTLSACQTGMTSETADGREVESIATVFQRKGASAVLSTLWPVADASTAAFMGTFYTLRSQDPRRTKAWCLREAQLRMIRGEVAPPGAPKAGKTRSVTPVKVVSRGLRKDWSHPYHWAPFILQGNPL